MKASVHHQIDPAARFFAVNYTRNVHPAFADYISSELHDNSRGGQLRANLGSEKIGKILPDQGKV